MVSLMFISSRQMMAFCLQRILFKERASRVFHRTSRRISWHARHILGRQSSPILPLIRTMMSFIIVTFGMVSLLGKTRSVSDIRHCLK
jgi:hypothetical protein